MKSIRSSFVFPAVRSRLASTVPCLLALLVGGGLLVSWRPVLAQAAAGELRTAAAVRGLTPQQAAAGVPVRLKGVVTFADQGLYSRFIQDETAGIYFGEMTNLPPFQAGQVIEIEGVTSPGEYAPIILPKSITVVDAGKLPAAKPVAIEQLVSGREDSQFVEISGIVRAVRFEEESQNYLLDLVMGGERFTAYARQLPTTATEELVDSTVQVRGVCSTLFNRQRQLFGFRLLVPRAEDVLVVKPAAANPFDIPTQSINSLLQFTPQGSFGHRVKVTGTVVYQEAGIALFIQDEKEGLYCQTRQRTPVQAGDRVEVLGFPAKGEYTPVLQDAVFRKVGPGTAPAPATLALDEVLAGTHDCRLIQINAKLLERTQRGREQFLVLENGGFIFHAYLGQDGGDGPGFAALQNGSEVSVAGVCLIERGSSWRAGEGWRAKSFRVLLRSPADVVVQKSPPLWKRWGIERIVGSLVIVILAAVLWISILHRRIAAHQAQRS